MGVPGGFHGKLVSLIIIIPGPLGEGGLIHWGSLRIRLLFSPPTTRTCSRLSRGNEPRKFRLTLRPRTISLVGHSQCHCVVQTSVLPTVGRFRKVLQLWLTPRSVTQRRQQRAVIVIPLGQSRSATSAFDRLWSHQFPALVALRSACKDDSCCSLPVNDAMLWLTPGCNWAVLLNIILPPPFLGECPAPMPVMAGTLARPVRTSRPWIPRLCRAPRHVEGHRARLFVHPPVTFPFVVSNSFDRSNGSARFLSFTPTGRPVQNIAHTIDRHPCFSICHLCSVACFLSLPAAVLATPTVYSFTIIQTMVSWEEADVDFCQVRTAQ